jgi:ATP-binding cassette subfamily B protein
MREMKLTHARPEDAGQLADLESRCFPECEAASGKQIEERIGMYGNHFVLLKDDDDRIVAYADGMVSNVGDLFDTMYEDAFLHKEDGRWQMIFGVGTDPAYRHQGLAGKVMHQMIQEAKEQNRYGLVLTCKDELVPFYSSFGFEDEGISSSSNHGGVKWHQMRLSLKEG